LKYLEDVPADESLWQGECYVFDQRVALGPGLTPGTHDACRACGHPVPTADAVAATTENAAAIVLCPECAA
jgi:UPF0176 protein